MLELLIAAVQESGDGAYSTEQILLFVGLPIVVVAGVVLVLRKRGAG